MGLYSDFEWMLRYAKTLDPINAKILEGLGKYGPRNIRFLAKSICLPPTTVGFRINRLMNEGYLRINANLDHPKLGLMKAVLLVDTLPKFEEIFWRAIENLGFWTYITRCYGKFDGIYALFAFPAEQKRKLEDYFDEVMRAEALANYLFFWITNPYTMPPSFLWFDFQEKGWNFRWQEWVEEILSASEGLPESLEDPEEYPITVDEIDLLILKELEKDGTVEFTKVADTVDLTPEGVRYRYFKHIIERNLIVDYDIAIFPYPPQISSMHSFIIDFENENALAKFANSLQNKPFIVSYAKVIQKNSVVVHTYTPKMEFPNFIRSLNRLAEEKLVKDFFHVTLDFTSFKRQTISYEFFKDGTWIYDQKRTLERTREIIECAS